MSILLEVLGEQINILRRLQQLLRVSHVLVHFVYRPRCNRFHLVSLLHCKIYVLLTDSCAVGVGYQALNAGGGGNSVALGYQTLLVENTSGGNNVAIGCASGS